MDISSFRRSGLLVLALATLMPLGAVVHAQPSASASAAETAQLDSAERAARAAEEWELKGASAFGDGETRIPELKRANASLSEYLRAHPDDVRALLLKARVSRALIVVTPVAVRLDDEGGGRIVGGDTTDLRSEALAAIGKVLAAHPDNAEAYYWKARTLMLSNRASEQVGAEAPFDPAPAVEAARTAVRLAPDNTQYREYLAMGLFGTGHAAEAVQELRKLPGKHPILQLIDDMDAIPLPAGAKQETDTYDFVKQLFSGNMDIFPYAGLRVGIQALPSTPAQVEAFYVRTWPKMHWVKEGEDSVVSGLAWRGDALEPVADPAPFTANLDEQPPPSGVLLVVSRDREAKPAQTRLFIINYRRF
jgi:hypothetical protein